MLALMASDDAIYGVSLQPRHSLRGEVLEPTQIPRKAAACCSTVAYAGEEPSHSPCSLLCESIHSPLLSSSG